MTRALAIAALLLGGVKVYNDFRMTQEYHAQTVMQERQAAALETIAAASKMAAFGSIRSAALAQAALECARPVMSVSVEGKSTPLCYKNGFASPPVACGGEQ